jgi:hypothetical protein
LTSSYPAWATSEPDMAATASTVVIVCIMER